MIPPFSAGWRPFYAPLLIGLLALLLRLLYLGEIQESLFFEIPLVDARTYVEDGVYLSTHSWAGRPVPFWQAPLYPYALGLSFWLFDQDLYLPRLFQALIGAGICVLIYNLGRRIFPFTVALGAGLLAAFYGPLIYFGGELLPTIPAIFLNLLLLLSLARAPSPACWPWLVSGLLLGFCTLAVSNIILFLPLLLFWLWSTNKGADIVKGHTWRQGALLVLGFILVIAPVTLRNYLVGGDLVLISHNAGVNFYIGNNPDYDRTVNIRPGQDWIELIDTPKNEAGILLPSAKSRFFFARSWSYIADDPLDYLKLLGRKFYLFWHGDEIRRNLDPYWARRDSGVLQVLLWKKGLTFPFGLIAPFALLGLVFFWRSKEGRTPQGRLLLYFVLAYMLSVVLFFVTSRYRLPAVPLLLLFAAFGLYRLWRRPNYRVRALLILVGLIVVTNIGAAPLDAAPDTQQRFWTGYAYEKKGMVANAMREYRAVVENRPDHQNALLSLANLYNAKRQYADAIKLYQQYLEFYPQAAEERFLLGNAYLNSKLYQEAIEVYTELIPLTPQWAALHGRLAYAHLAAGQPQRAVQAYRQTLSLNPDSTLVRYQLVRLYESTGDIEAAEKESRTLITQEPKSASYHTLLADLLIRQERAEKGALRPGLPPPRLSAAEELLHRAVELDADFVQARWSLGLLFAGQKRYAEAIAHFERILLLSPAEFEVHRHLGNLYKRTGNLEKADEHYGHYSLAEREKRMRHLAETSAEKQLKKFLGK